MDIMLKTFKELGIKDDMCKMILDKYSLSQLYSLEADIDNFKKIYNYLKNIGIKNVDELLYINIDLFTYSYNKFIQLLSEKNNLMMFVNRINEEAGSIFELL